MRHQRTNHHHAAENVSKTAFWHHRLEPAEMGKLFALVPSRRTDPYFMSHADIDAEDAVIFRETNQSAKRMARLPCRLHTLLDLVAWNRTYGFLSTDYLLAPYPTDPEVRFSRYAHIDTFVYDKQAGTSESSKPEGWGDLHLPLERFAGKRGLPGFGRYGLVLFAQTLEHLYDPVLCLRNMHRAMAPGGFLFTSVPMLNHLHMAPIFFSEPTPYGLVVWMKQAGFDVLRVGVFGNELYMENLGKYIHHWPKWERYYNATRRPQIINDHTRPVQSWVLVRKPV